MLAIDEYDDVKERQEDLQDRKATLEEEKDAINERMEAYEETKREKFMQAFEAINDEFRTVFERLSDGTGELVLEDPNAPFESGMTIEAKPQDKPVKRVEKVAETIDEIADATQFVVISHRSNMVEKADRIVGVTMQDDNVSTVTGVKVNDGSDGEDTGATAD
jgi:chromosome segregation protein